MLTLQLHKVLCLVLWGSFLSAPGNEVYSYKCSTAYALDSTLLGGKFCNMCRYVLPEWSLTSLFNPSASLSSSVKWRMLLITFSTLWEYGQIELQSATNKQTKHKKPWEKHQFYKKKKLCLGTSLVVQWLRLCTPNAGGLGLIPGQGTRGHM